MNESFLKKTSILVFFIGFLGLICLFLFQKPFFVSLDSTVPLDHKFILNATINDLYQTDSGVLLSFSYLQYDSAFFPGNVSFLEKGSFVSIQGIKTGNYMTIDKITST